MARSSAVPWRKKKRLTGEAAVAHYTMVVERPRAWISALVVLLCAGIGLHAAGDRRLVDAARARDNARVRALLAERMSPNDRQADGATALHWAAHWDDGDIAELLITAGADVNAVNDLGVTPLQLACTNGSSAMTRRLLARGARPDLSLASNEVTPLMTCARSGNSEAVRQLLAHGANANAAETFKGQTALMWAVAGNHTDVARALVEGGARIDTKSAGGFTPLLFAAQQGNLESTRLLLTAGASVDGRAPDGATALLVAVESGHAELASFLLDRGANVNDTGAGRTPLHAAVQAARPDIATMLLARGADPNAKLTRRLPRVAGELTGGPVSLLGATPFWLAAKFADARMMRLLEQHGADPLLSSNDRTTPLMVAAGIGWVDGQDRYGNLMFASDLSAHRQADLDAVALALSYGAPVNAVNDHGQTAMHGAAYMGGDEVVRLLADRGASLAVVDKYGQTPLVIADGVYVGGAFVARKTTAAQLRALGAERTHP